jgi:hypothetical protein
MSTASICMCITRWKLSTSVCPPVFLSSPFYLSLCRHYSSFSSLPLFTLKEFREISFRMCADPIALRMRSKARNVEPHLRNGLLIRVNSVFTAFCVRGSNLIGLSRTNNPNMCLKYVHVQKLILRQAKWPYAWRRRRKRTCFDSLPTSINRIFCAHRIIQGYS